MSKKKNKNRGKSKAKTSKAKSSKVKSGSSKVKTGKQNIVKADASKAAAVRSDSSPNKPVKTETAKTKPSAADTKKAEKARSGPAKSRAGKERKAETRPVKTEKARTKASGAGSSGKGSAVREKTGKHRVRRAYFYDLDIVRALACIAVLLYHIGILKGGYLAVCTFFVLSGYLSTTSAAEQQTFSFKRYYLRRLRQLYLPLAAVTLITVLVVSVIPGINWLNLKPETTSVLLGYNNWWQLAASLDYFARHVTSPFMHFWYVAIQLQFDLVFPLLYKFLEKVRNKEGEQAPKLLLCMGIFLSAVYMSLLDGNGSVMAAYYDTFSRLNALLAGVLWGFVHTDRRGIGSGHKLKSSTKGGLFWTCVAVWAAMMMLCSSSTGAWAMILTVPLSILIIEFGTRERAKKEIDRYIGYVSGISYEVYLVQYPVIFLAQELFVSGTYIPPEVKAAEAAVTVIMAILLRTAGGVRRGQKNGFLKIAALCLVVAAALAGAGEYVAAEDHTEEMKQLEAQLEEISAGLEQRQAELLEKRKQEEADWEAQLAELQDSDEGLRDIVKQLPIVGIGDSVMLGALPALYSEFPNGYFDAEKSRTTYVADSAVSAVENMGLMGDVVVFNFGANGEGPDYLRENVVDRLSDKKVFWLTNTNDYMLWVNDDIKELAARKDNLHVIDWYEVSRGHGEYFYSDEIHLTDAGQKAFADAIFDSICEVYREEWQKRIDEMIADHEAQELKKVTFYGNDLLTGVYPLLDPELQDSEMIVSSGEGGEIVDMLRRAVSEGKLTHRVVLMFDSTAYLGSDDYSEILEICTGHDVSIVSFESISVPGGESVLIDVSDISADISCFMPDWIHLSETGNGKMAAKISSRLLGS